MKSQKLEPLDRLINEFTKLPGVGYKTAQRYAYAVINNMTQEEAGEFAKALMEAKQKSSIAVFAAISRIKIYVGYVPIGNRI